jgi:hypothetical protein
MSGLTQAVDRVVESAESLAKKMETAVENELAGNKTPKDGSTIQAAPSSPLPIPSAAVVSTLFSAVKGALNIVGTAASNYDQIVATAIASTPSNDVETVIGKVRNLMSYAKNDLTAFDEAVVFARTLVKI